MKYPLLIVTLAVLSAGCDPAPTSTSSPSSFPTRTATNAAMPEVKDYPFARKADFTAKMRTELAEINRELDLLGAKIEQSGEAVKSAAQPKFKGLRELSDKFKNQLEDAGNASESTWEDVKSGTAKAFESLKEGFQQSRQWLSEKIAP